MFNHVRTLLVNRDGADGTTVLGDELTPATFKAGKLDGGQQAVRRILFGTDPDQYMLNYRVRQLLSLIHASPLVEFVTALDPRITYRFDTADLFADSYFAPTVFPLSGQAQDLRVIGSAAAPDISGQMRHSVRLEMLDGDTINVTQSYPLRSTTNDLGFDNGLSQKLKLGVSGYEFRVAETAGSGDSWLVEVLNRPQYDLAQLVANLKGVGEPALLSLFGTARTEPLQTFKNLWFDNRELPLQLGGLVMALAYSTEARRG